MSSYYYMCVPIQRHETEEWPLTSTKLLWPLTPLTPLMLSCHESMRCRHETEEFESGLSGMRRRSGPSRLLCMRRRSGP
jgi:hypothetical protein